MDVMGCVRMYVDVCTYLRSTSSSYQSRRSSFMDTFKGFANDGQNVI